MDRIPSPVINNHNSVENVDPAFSDDESEPTPPKIIKIEDEEDELPLGAYLRIIFQFLAIVYAFSNVYYSFASGSQIKRKTYR